MDIVGSNGTSAVMTPVKELSEFLSYDWTALWDQKDVFGSFFLHPIVPVVAVIMYWYLSAPVCNWIRTTLALEPKGAFIQNLTIVHSSVLALYSLWTFVNSVIILNKYMRNKTMMESLCDYDEKLWDV